MAKPASPSMPTPRQIAEALEAVRASNPGARIVSVGPDGVKFAYDDAVVSDRESPEDRRKPLSWT